METMGGWRCRCFGSLDVTLGLLADVATGPLSTRQATARLPQATLAKHGAQGVHSPTATPRNTSRYAKTDVHPVRPSAHIVMASKKPEISVFRHPHPFPRVMPLLVAWCSNAGRAMAMISQKPKTIRASPSPMLIPAVPSSSFLYLRRRASRSDSRRQRMSSTRTVWCPS